ncbi:MAG: transcription termination/antitermination protein NusG [Pirellulales bacterium]
MTDDTLSDLPNIPTATETAAEHDAPAPLHVESSDETVQDPTVSSGAAAETESEAEAVAPAKRAAKKAKAAEPDEPAVYKSGESDEPASEEINKQWYILKVATNREDSIRDALQRKVAMSGLDRYFGDILVPVELLTEFKNGKKRVTKHKLYPGYIVVNMEINDDTWYAIRETSGIGDFAGAMGRPAPMSASDIAKILPKTDAAGAAEQPKAAIKYKQGDHVRIKEGMFANFEGNIEAIDEASGRVTVIVNIFGRSTPVDIEFWQVETV